MSLPVAPGGVAPARPVVMGVVNVTPDSFSDGGEWFSADAAIAHGFELVAQGSDIVDIGGESTRPGARRPGVDEELRRVLPVIRELVAAGAVVSIDTMRASVAGAALDAGAAFVNDVSGGQADAAMASVVAAARVAAQELGFQVVGADTAPICKHERCMRTSSLRSAPSWLGA